MYKKISVLIPAYNCGQFIKEAIESILIQDYACLEIIVTDDGSTDDTQEIVSQIQSHSQSSPIHYFRKEHSGISATRNFCLEKATGEYIAWLDADDYWLPGKLHAQIKYLEAHPNCRIVFTKFENFFENEELKTDIRAINEMKISERSKHYLPSSLGKKEIYKQCAFKTELIIGEDVEMLYRFKSADIDMEHFLDRVYVRRRLHGKNITFQHQPLSAGQYMNKLILPNLKNKIQQILFYFTRTLALVCAQLLRVNKHPSSIAAARIGVNRIPHGAKALFDTV